jgi:hypothetical protein
VETAFGDAIAVDEPTRRGWPRLVLVALLSALVEFACI